MPGNGYGESFNGKLKDGLLDAEAFNTLVEAEVLVERRRRHYSSGRPHSSLGYRPPAPEVVVLSATPPPNRPRPIGSAQQQAAMLPGLLHGPLEGGWSVGVVPTPGI